MRGVSIIGVSLVVAGLVPGFLGGVVAGRTLFATSVNAGLVNAFSSVGQNLFGEGVFGANVVPPSPIAPNGGVEIAVSKATQVPVSMDLFIPPNPIFPTEPCRRAAEISVANGITTLTVDQSLLTTDNFQLVYGSLPTSPAPNVPAMCPVQTNF